MNAFGFKKESWPGELPDVKGYFHEKFPTYEKQLDRYFDEHFEAIITEWDLLREPDLQNLEQRLDRVINEVKVLTKTRRNLEERSERLSSMIAEMEAKV